jgi:hypothetical protein
MPYRPATVDAPIGLANRVRSLLLPALAMAARRASSSGRRRIVPDLAFAGPARAFDRAKASGCSDATTGQPSARSSLRRAARRRRRSEDILITFDHLAVFRYATETGALRSTVELPFSPTRSPVTVIACWSRASISRRWPLPDKSAAVPCSRRSRSPRHRLAFSRATSQRRGGAARRAGTRCWWSIRR